MRKEYLVFERFGNRYEFRYVAQCQADIIEAVTHPKRYHVVESHKLFVPPRITEEQWKIQNL